MTSPSPPYGRLRRTAVLLVPTLMAVLSATGPAPVSCGLISLIQNNVLGSAEFHRQQSWPFDPSAGQRRAHEFAMLHGDRSERLIERIGLGIDGRQAERREQQSVRDFLYDREQRQEEQRRQQVQQQQQQQQNAVYAPPDYPAPRLQVLSAGGAASGYEKR